MITISPPAKRSFVLAVSFQNGMIYMLKSFDDVLPVQVNTELNGALGMVIEWSNSRELLAVAGSLQSLIPQFDSQGQVVHENVLKFYTEHGTLLYMARIPTAMTTTAPVSALTWGHNDKRIFIATGNQVHIAWVSRKVASLQLLCRLQIQSSLTSEGMLMKLPLPSRLKSLIGNLFAQTVRVSERKCKPSVRSPNSILIRFSPFLLSVLCPRRQVTPRVRVPAAQLFHATALHDDPPRRRRELGHVLYAVLGIYRGPGAAAQGQTDLENSARVRDIRSPNGLGKEGGRAHRQHRKWQQRQ